MIIGRGDIASAIVDRPDRLYFASGVSNSGETRRAEFQREINLLLRQDRDRHLVYFSSLSVFYAVTAYAEHKRHVENIIRLEFPRRCIVRLGNITWGSNPHTLINYLRMRYLNCEPYELRDEWRYVVDRAEFQHWLDLIPAWTCEMNITGRRLKVADIFKEYVTDVVQYA